MSTRILVEWMSDLTSASPIVPLRSVQPVLQPTSPRTPHALFAAVPCSMASYSCAAGGATLWSQGPSEQSRAIAGLDHGAGHPLLPLCHAKAPNYLKKKGFKDLPDYSKWPKVADAVIEALLPTHS